MISTFTSQLPVVSRPYLPWRHQTLVFCLGALVIDFICLMPASLSVPARKSCDNVPRSPARYNLSSLHVAYDTAAGDIGKTVMTCFSSGAL